MAKHSTKGMNMEVVGDVALGRKFQALKGVGTADLLEAILLAVAEPIREHAANNAPRRTGKLSKEIIKKTIEKRKDRVVVGIGPSKKAWYGKFPEYGTSKTAAQPYLRPAFDGGKATAKQDALSKLWDAIEGVAKS